MKFDLDASELGSVVAVVADDAVDFAAVACEAGVAIVDVSMIYLTGPVTDGDGGGDGDDDVVDVVVVAVVVVVVPVERAAVVAFAAAVVQHFEGYYSRCLVLDHLVSCSH